jgi:dipeptidyl aminopeptidase/acylaminoacyl peptidase
MGFRGACAGAVAFGLLWCGVAQAAAAAADAPPPLEAFGRLPHVDNIVISPSGKRTAFVIDTPKGRSVVVAEGVKPLMRQLIIEAPAHGAQAQKEGKIRYLEWADDDHLVVGAEKTENLVALTGRKEAIQQVAVLNASTRTSFWVFEHAGDVLQAVFGEYGFAKKNGHTYGYFTGQPTDDGRLIDRLDLFQVDLDSKHTTAAAYGTDLQRSWLVGKDGALLAYADYDAKTQDWRLYEGRRRELLTQDKKNAYDSADLDGQGRTAGTIIFEKPDDDGQSQYFETSLAKGAPQARLFEGQLVSRLLHDRRTGLLVGMVTDGDYPEITYFDPVREARWKGTKKAFAGLNVSLQSADDAYEHLIVLTEGEGDPGTYWQVDLTTGKAEPFGEAYPDIPAKAVGARKVFDYKAADGLQLHGILTLPVGRDPKNLPVIVLPHGGPHARDYLSFDWWPAALASRGYAVFQPNFRGSSGYGVKFAQAGFGEWGRKMQTDISDGLKALADQGIVDPKRACIVGASYGGYAALAGVTVQQGLYRCAVAVAGVSDLRAMLSDEADQHDEQSWEVRWWKDWMGAKSLGDGALRKISPANLADHADAPILLIHGKDDTTVPIEQSRIMERALKRAGKPVEFVQLDSEDHYLSRQATREAMLTAVVAFVEKYDPPK